jgi:RNA polymerase sigma-70 factor (ECF subfamily)
VNRDDERRLEQLAEAHAPRVLAYLARRTGNPAVAADVFQAVLVTTWRRLPDVPADDHAALAWLLGTARRCLANDRRGQARRLQATERLRSTIRVFATDPTERSADVSRALMDLGDGDRELLTLIYWEDLTVEQAARVLDITPVAARKRLERARARLRLLLEASRTTTNGQPLDYEEIASPGSVLGPTPGSGPNDDCVTLDT